MNKLTVIHEFGHVAGLAHEFLHPDADLCIVIPAKPDPKLTYVPFDRESAMGYCNLRPSLREDDKALLKKLYP